MLKKQVKNVGKKTCETKDENYVPKLGHHEEETCINIDKFKLKIMFQFGKKPYVIS